mmetsp:Transcript_6560/g.10339  ORF Transcript_6560/g.10339 Transcript_6560/m.10339 type:complete len:285 (-) Transcript_6560:54-908(-)|eukprot:CAMPEP_0203758954 /NCGR_PEP_ID=MMETSP0098-20131031/11861_1 /ASSEMBLY_ACC=CAM_ASM_000208 /TAXON_ID=96639 /ORGANISM=" , Strain NY0313808BC1" /LENGTH=284 /DNA_ID=CAMNT_0050651649 /DNA_START=325 /DNA_END=1179 /DNA_ORIENTATION=-
MPWGVFGQKRRESFRGSSKTEVRSPPPAEDAFLNKMRRASYKARPAVRKKMNRVKRLLPFLSSTTTRSKETSYRANDQQPDAPVTSSYSWSESNPLIDPILLTPIEEDEEVFCYIRPNGTQVYYRVETLIDYMLASGRFCEPETSLEFTEQHLKELDKIALNAGMKKRSVLKSKQNPSEFTNQRFNSSALLGLERCCGELVGRIPATIEETETREMAQVVLLTEIFPNIRHYFAQMLESNEEYARQSLAQYIQFIKGPPNKPVEDSHDLVQYCTDFLLELIESV